jgi:DNA-binding SARP family transcriptional activator
VQFRILGPVELWVAGVRTDLGPLKQRTMLAALLIDPGHPVTQETLIERVWGGTPPAEVRNAVYTYITRLRRILERAASRDGSRINLMRRSGGYLLEVDHDRIDVHRFLHLLKQAGTASVSEPECAAFLRQALSIWHGTPLADLQGSWAARVRERLIRQRCDSLVARADVEMRLGYSAVIVEELREALAEQPLAEGLICQLLRVLYHVGRGAEALDTYARARTLIVDEVGAEPCAELRRVHQEILCETLPLPAGWRRVEGSDRPPQSTCGPSALGSMAATPEPQPGDGTVARLPARRGFTPCLLPADIADFTGREDEVDQLIRALSSSHPHSVAVAAVVGRSGLGKTALAVHVAHRMRGEFPDGQLYVDLRGDGREPVNPWHVLDRFLRILGVASSAVPDTLDERAELYRVLLAGRRVLVVLDNAADEAQVVSLLPGSVPCGVLVTSRARFAGISCTRITLEVLGQADAVRLLAQVVGEERVWAEAREAHKLIALCGRWPLAVRIAGARLVARPHRGIAQFVAHLEDERHRLDELTYGKVGVRDALDGSYQRLDPQARQLFRQLGLLDIECFAAQVAGPLLDTDEASADNILDQLVDAQLVDAATGGRCGQVYYQFNELIRVFARNRAEAEESEREVRRIAILRREIRASLLAEASWVDLGKQESLPGA